MLIWGISEMKNVWFCSTIKCTISIVFFYLFNGTVATLD